MSGAQGLTDDVRPAHHEYILAARRLAGPGHRLVQAVHEGESAFCGSVIRPVGHDEEGRPERIVAAPCFRRLVCVAAADDGTHAGYSCVEELLVRARRLAPRLLGVAPWAAEDPVMQSLTAVAQAPARPVVRPGDVPVQ